MLVTDHDHHGVSDRDGRGPCDRPRSGHTEVGMMVARTMTIIPPPRQNTVFRQRSKGQLDASTNTNQYSSASSA
eukprot:446806-Prymnesium_polylepis.2